jgi:hypothetical protein
MPTLTYEQCCEILDVEPGASETTIKAHYRKLAMLNHPDKNKNSPESEAKFKELQSALDFLEEANFKDPGSSNGTSFTRNSYEDPEADELWERYQDIVKQRQDDLKTVKKMFDEERAPLRVSLDSLKFKNLSDFHTLPKAWIEASYKLNDIIDLVMTKKFEFYEAQLAGASLEELLYKLKRHPEEEDIQPPEPHKIYDSGPNTIDMQIYSRIRTHQQLIHTFITQIAEINQGITAVATWQHSVDPTKSASWQAKDLADSARELAADLINQFHVALTASSAEIKVSKNSMSISQDLEYDHIKALKSIITQTKDLSSIMSNFKNNELPTKQAVSALKWESTLWIKFTTALGNLIDAAKHLVFKPDKRAARAKESAQTNQKLRHHFVSNLKTVTKNSPKRDPAVKPLDDEVASSQIQKKKNPR